MATTESTNLPVKGSDELDDELDDELRPAAKAATPAPAAPTITKDDESPSEEASKLSDKEVWSKLFPSDIDNNID